MRETYATLMVLYGQLNTTDGQGERQMLSDSVLSVNLFSATTSLH